jgi:flagellin
MIINHNLSAIDAHRHLKINTFYTNKNIEKLSSGLRVNRAGDDAAGLSISEKMRAQIRGLNQASRNAQDGISFIQTAEGYLNQTTMLLQRLRELSIQSATGTYTNEDRYQIKVEVEQLVNEIDRIAEDAQFNTIRMLRGGLRTPGGWNPAGQGTTNSPGEATAPATASSSPTRFPFPDPANAAIDGDVHDFLYKPQGQGEEMGGLYLHIGPNKDQRIKIFIQNNSAIALGLRDSGTKELMPDVTLLSQDGANRSIQVLDAALNYVNSQRADLGAFQNRLEGVVQTTDYAAENLQAAESQIRDVDIAKEMVDFVKNQILSQSTSAMLVHANMRPQLVMRILG